MNMTPNNAMQGTHSSGAALAALAHPDGERWASRKLGRVSPRKPLGRSECR